MTFRSLILLALLSAASLLLLWTDAIPLGIPGEWIWPRLRYTNSGIRFALTILLLCSPAYLGLAWFSQRKIERARTIPFLAWITGLFLASWGWLWLIQSVSIEGIGLGKGPYVLGSRSASGYFHLFRYPEPGHPSWTLSDRFLDDYEQEMAKGDTLHIGTHPPGLMFDYLLLHKLIAAHPWLITWAEATMTAETEAMFAELAARGRNRGEPLLKEDIACLWLAVQGTHLIAAATVIPLFGFLRLTESRTTAWRVVFFWPLLPAIGIFLPKSDVLYPCLAITAAWCWRSAWRSCSLVRVLTALAAGLVLFVGMAHSLAFLPVGALLAIQTICDGWPSSFDQHPSLERVLKLQKPVRRAMMLLALGALGFVGPMIAIAGTQSFSFLSIWYWNFANHQAFYDHNIRTYGKWLLVNPIELTLAVGVPIVWLVLVGTWQLIRARKWPSLRTSAILPVTIVGGLLWLSGKNMGEAARLWIFLMPWIVASAAPALRPHDTTDRGATTTGMSSRLWLMMLAAQLVVSAFTVLRVDGFHLTGFDVG